MPAEIKTGEPTEIVVGTKLSFLVDLDEWSPAEGTLSFAYQPIAGGAGGFTKAATDNGDGRFLVSIESADTSGKTPGRWHWSSRFNDGADYYFLDSGESQFVANPFDGAADLRTYWEKVRDSIALALETDDNAHVSGYSIDNRSLSKASKEELFEALAYSEDMVEREQDEIAAARGETVPNRTLIRLQMP